MKFRVNEKNMFYGADYQTFEAATILRKNMTLPELILWKRLKNKKLFNIKFRRQHPINIFIVDFYCHKCKLVIEIDGEIHNSNEKREYDEGRTYELERYGLKVIRFTNEQVTFKIDSVIKHIQKVISDLGPLQGAVPL